MRTLPRELWAVVFAHLSSCVGVLCTLRAVCSEFRELVAQLPVAIRARCAGRAMICPINEHQAQLCRRMFGNITSVSLSWALCRRYATAGGGMLRKMQQVRAMQALGVIRARHIRFCGDADGAWAAGIMECMDLSACRTLVLHRVRVTRRLAQLAVSGLRPDHVSFTPAYTLFGVHHQEHIGAFLRAATADAKRISLSSVTPRMLAAVVAAASVTEIKLGGCSPRVCVRALLVLPTVERLVLRRLALEGESSFVDEYTGLLDSRPVSKSLRHFELEEHNDSVNVIAISGPQMLTLLHPFRTLVSLRLSGVCRWQEGLLEYIAMGMGQLQGLWFTPINTHEEGGMTELEARALAGMRCLRGAVLPDWAFDGSEDGTCAILANGVPTLAADTANGPHHRPIRFQYCGLRTPAVQAAFRAGAALPRPLPFPAIFTDDDYGRHSPRAKFYPAY